MDDSKFDMSSIDPPTPYDADVSPPEYFRVVDMRTQGSHSSARGPRCDLVTLYFACARHPIGLEADEERVEIILRMMEMRECAEGMGIVLPSLFQDVEPPAEVPEPEPEPKAEQRMPASRARLASQAAGMARRRKLRVPFHSKRSRCLSRFKERPTAKR